MKIITTIQRYLAYSVKHERTVILRLHHNYCLVMIMNEGDGEFDLPVSLSRINLQLSTSPMLEKRDRISSCVMLWGK